MQYKITRRNNFLLFLLILLPFFASCRSIRYLGSGPGDSGKLKEKRIAIFPDIMHETSGLEYFAGRFWTFNDSGGEALLYSFDPFVADLDLKFYFTGLVNIDWEDICADSKNLYIADIGNNFGNRDTLSIYKIEIDSFLAGRIDFQTIQIQFSEKTPEKSNYYGNPFDCEAIIIKNDSLWLFTKNWEDESSWIYKIPAVPAYYNLPSPGQLKPQMLVTGAEYLPEEQKLWLIGYHKFIPVIIRYEMQGSIPLEEFKLTLKNRFGLQTEAICTDNKGQIYFTNEKSFGRQGFWSLSWHK